METFMEYFKGKRVTLMGLGLLGRGVGDAEFLAKCGAHIVVTDKKTESELQESVDRLKKYNTIEFHLGGHREEDFTHTDMVIKAAGVALDSPEVALAKKNNVPVVMSTALFAKYAIEAGAIIVGVTGTRGKSTVAHLIFRSLQRAGRKSLLGGNVRGISTLALLSEIGRGDIAVLELDSWQLQGFGDLQISPHVSVFTNLMPDHQNYYPDMEAYFADKANIFRYQTPSDFLFVGKTIFEKVSAARPKVAPHVPPAIPEDWKLKIVGQHNLENAALAAAALGALGLSEKEIRDGIESFEGVEGRLQFVRDVGGKKIYNDNNATTPEATIAALDSLGENITLIIGGAEKNLPLEKLASKIKETVSQVILLAHENYKGSLRLAGELKSVGVPFEEAESLEQAIGLAVQTTSGTILFSPAFASFGMFKNEYERNDRFMELVRAL